MKDTKHINNADQLTYPIYVNNIKFLGTTVYVNETVENSTRLLAWIVTHEPKHSSICVINDSIHFTYNSL